MKKVIAILGLPGSGKSEVINYCQDKFSWPKVYFGEVTFDEMKKRGLAMNQDNERLVREDLRKKFGKDYYAKETLKKIKKIKDSDYILAESLYSWGEYLIFKKAFKDKFFAIAVYASPDVRYKRLAKRKIRPLNAKEAQKRDYAQLEKLEQGAPIAVADFTVINEGSLKELRQNLDKIIKQVISKK